MFAAVALLLALVSTGVALFAVNSANEARRQADLAVSLGRGDQAGQTPGPAAQPTAPAPADPGGGAPTAPGGDPASIAPDVLNPQAVYTVKYQKEVLRLQSGCSDSRYIDLDEPRVGVDGAISDLTFYGACTNITQRFVLDDVVGAQATSSQVTPNECAELIRTGPLDSDATVAAQRGLILCVATSPSAARTQGIPRRMAVLEVTAVSGDGIVSVQVSAWNVPN